MFFLILLRAYFLHIFFAIWPARALRSRPPSRPQSCCYLQYFGPLEAARHRRRGARSRPGERVAALAPASSLARCGRSARSPQVCAPIARRGRSACAERLRAIRARTCHSLAARPCSLRALARSLGGRRSLAPRSPGRSLAGRFGQIQLAVLPHAKLLLFAILWSSWEQSCCYLQYFNIPKPENHRFRPKKHIFFIFFLKILLFRNFSYFF